MADRGVDVPDRVPLMFSGIDCRGLRLVDAEDGAGDGSLDLSPL